MLPFIDIKKLINCISDLFFPPLGLLNYLRICVVELNNFHSNANNVLYLVEKRDIFDTELIISTYFSSII